MSERGTSGEDTSTQAQRPERGEVSVGGVRLVYRRWLGPQRRRHRCPPVLLLHGLLQSGEGMANLAAHLARNGPVVVPDLRGRGESDQPANDYDPATMADDVAGLISALALERPVVIGRLHGGLIGYHLAARRPDLVRGLVLGDTAPEIDEQRASAALAFVRSLPRHFESIAEALAFYQDRLGLSEARARHDIPYDLIEGDNGQLRWRHNLDVIERIEAAAMPRADWDVLAQIRTPVLMLRGQRGEVPLAVAERFRQTVPSSRVQTIYGARHDVFLGPGAEQAFGAVDLFLMRLPDAAPSPKVSATDQLSLLENTPASISADQIPLPGAEPPSMAGRQPLEAGAVIERIVRAINGRDDAVIEALFAPDARVIQHRLEGDIRGGGIGAAHAAFWDIFAQLPGGVVAARDEVVSATGDHAAAVLVLRDIAATPTDASSDSPTAEEGEGTILAPIFFRLRDGRITEFVSYALRLAKNFRENRIDDGDDAAVAALSRS